MDKQRYFYITYSYYNGTGSTLKYGFNYPNQNKVIEFIKENTGVSECLITNIIEMSKEDFEEFTRTEEK